MPFTPAHAMAVLPLHHARRWLRLDATCLVIGSMAPDFEYFLRIRLDGRFGHTNLGLFVFCLPVTLCFAAVFHAFAKWCLVLVAPVAITRRVLPLARRPWIERLGVASVASLVISALVGAVTHLVWDSFTHWNGWPVEHWIALRRFHHFPIIGWSATHEGLQQLSTLVGLAVLAIVVVVELRRTPPVALPEVRRAGPRLVFAACWVLALAVAFVRIRMIHQVDLGNVVVAMISGSLGGTMLAGLLLFDASAPLRAP